MGQSETRKAEKNGADEEIRTPDRPRANRLACLSCGFDLFCFTLSCQRTQGRRIIVFLRTSCEQEDHSATSAHLLDFDSYYYILARFCFFSLLVAGNCVRGMRPIFIAETRRKYRQMDRKLKSISVLVPVERVQSSLSELGFLLDGSATIVAEGKFWNRMLYTRGQETVCVSDEIGDVYPKDPVITICGSGNTISKVIGMINNSEPAK